MGCYVLTTYPIVKGSAVASLGVNTLLQKQKDAVIKKYGKIDNSKYYKFTVVQHVIQANIASLKGTVKSVVCNNTY